jgi:hypothetical protein
MKRLRDIAVNVGVSLGAIALTLLVLELIVFRFVLPGSDLPWNAYIDNVIRYAPNQTGVWRVRNEIAAPYAINGQGWNSGVGDYALERRPGIRRIAVIGDSYVEGLQVPYDQSLAEQISYAMAAAGQPTEVYRFAISGAPMSHYLYMAEREAARYRPDWIVVVLVDNDYDESFRFRPGRYTSAFQKLRVKNGRVTGEIPPTPWNPSWGDLLRQTAIMRFLAFRWQLKPERLSAAIFPDARAEPVDPDADIKAVTRYAIARLDAVARQIGAQLLVVVNGDAGAIYSGAGETRARALNRIAAEAAAANKVAFLDLDTAFATDWRANRKPLNFISDGHWNARAHGLAGAAIARFLLEAQ